MPQLRRLLWPGAAVAALLVAASVAPAERPAGAAPLGCAAAAADEPRPACCFQNPRYVGTCQVQPAKDETCASILEYLNNPQSAGKQYCNSTAVRGGWKIVPCEPQMKTD
jgi:curli biogenesis system outer membrane secretion channel CsgG